MHRLTVFPSIGPLSCLMADTLPRDSNGICVIPHRHRMEKQRANDDAMYLTSSGRLAYRTNKVCDNCQKRILDAHFFHCSEGCDIDFCEDCQSKLREVFESFFAHTRDEADKEHRYQQLVWVISITECVAAQILRQTPEDRTRLAHEFAFEWPTALFGRLVRVVTDVINAKVVHVQDVKDIQSDQRFWYTVGLLQFLYSANALPCQTKIVDGSADSRGPKVEYTSFILDGINKCEPISEWQRWREHPSAKVPDMLAISRFEVTVDFCSFLTHNNLVPVSFRRVCLLCDIWEQIQMEVVTGMGRVVPLQIEVRRDPPRLLEDLLSNFGGMSDGQLRRPLRVTFEGEEGAGMGVLREFFQVALRSFLDSSGSLQLFNFNEQLRTYWFNDGADNPMAFRACGVLLGQAVLNSILVPNIFPSVFYERLLHDLESPYARPLGLDDVSKVSRETAMSLHRILEYAEDDVGTVFGGLDFAPLLLPEDFRLSQSTKQVYVDAYVSWFFHGRIAAQLTPLSEGFRAIVGSSSLLQRMIGAVQLEQIVCGASVPVDIPAIRRGSAHEGWAEDEQEYLALFWDVVESFSDQEKIQFIVFVTASCRVPLRGWQDLQMVVQKNGTGDERLPSAHTCFCQLLLPRYTSRETLAACLRTAIANSEGFGLK